MILAYASQQDYDAMAGQDNGKPAWTPEEVAGMVASMEKLNNELMESGELVDTRGLAAPVLTRRYGAKDGVPVVTDGPYAETQEVLAGYWIVECESLDRATEIAARFGETTAPDYVRANSYVDIRPIVGDADDLVN